MVLRRRAGFFAFVFEVVDFRLRLLVVFFVFEVVDFRLRRLAGDFFAEVRFREAAFRFVAITHNANS